MREIVIDTDVATATARVGYAYWDRLLVCAKGGAVIATKPRAVSSPRFLLLA
jgi:hypothetical protein